MSLKVGNDHKLYYNTGTAASPTWVAICIVGDVSVDININAAEVDIRCSTWILNLPAKLTGGFNFTLAADVGGVTYDALRVIALARTIVQMASANALIATVGTQLFKAYAFFTAFPWNQPSQEMASGDATMALGYFEDAPSQIVFPAWATIAA